MKRSIGTIFTLITIIAAVVGLAAYITNASTNYFGKLGKDGVIIGCLVIAIVALIAWCALGEDKASWKDILVFIAPALIIVSFMLLLNSRVNGIAAIMTYEANEQNSADMQSAMIALIAMAAAAFLGAFNAFFDVRKSQPDENEK